MPLLKRKEHLTMDDNAIRLGNWLNLLVASSVFAMGLYYLFRSTLLKKKSFLKGVLIFWLGQWLMFVLSWSLIIFIYPGKNGYLLLILSDLQSILAIGFSIALLFGEEFKQRWWTIVRSLVTTYVLLLLINALASLAALAGGSNFSQAFLELFEGRWIATGQVLSLVADCMLGLAFVLRFGWLGLYMLAACVFYATLQSPIYGVLFGSGSAFPIYVTLALAFGKALLGAIFYWLFFEQAASYGRVTIPLLPAPGMDWRGFARRGGTLLGLALVVAGIAFYFHRSAASSPLLVTVRVLLVGMLAYASLAITLLTLLYRWLTPKLIPVHFTVHNVSDVNPGDRIYLTGNCRELGEWWPGEPKAKLMSGTHSAWSADVLLPSQLEIEFKFIKIAGRTLTWENGNNHIEAVPGEGSLSITQDWRR
jgi:hypothetical protein